MSLLILKIGSKTSQESGTYKRIRHEKYMYAGVHTIAHSHVCVACVPYSEYISRSSIFTDRYSSMFCRFNFYGREQLCQRMHCVYKRACFAGLIFSVKPHKIGHRENILLYAICKFCAGVSVEMVASRRDMLSLAIRRTPLPLWCFRRHGNSRG